MLSDLLRDGSEFHLRILICVCAFWPRQEEDPTPHSYQNVCDLLKLGFSAKDEYCIPVAVT